MAALDFIANHLALEPVLIARLLAQVTTLSEVGGAGEFDRMLTDGEPTPSAYVLYAGDQAGGYAGKYVQHWQVVLVAKPGLAEAGDSISAAGALLSKINAALFNTGWNPADNARKPERLYGDGEPAIYAGGLVYFTLSFSVELSKPIQ
jgi:hypothetical protein